jgi:hypothetical protein
VNGPGAERKSTAEPPEHGPSRGDLGNRPRVRRSGAATARDPSRVHRDELLGAAPASLTASCRAGLPSLHRRISSPARDLEKIARQIIAIVDGAALQFLSLDDGVFEEIIEEGVAGVLDRLAKSVGQETSV